MEKINSFRKGSVWVNVFETQNSELAVTINRSFKDKDGKWRYTPFFRSQNGDLMDLVDALCQFMDYRDERKAQDNKQVEQILTLQRWVQ